MLPDYQDIRSRIDEEPKWFDGNGVPRYCKFEPRRTCNIYAREVLLLEIACQSCGKRFHVETNWSRWGYIPSYLERIERETARHIKHGGDLDLRIGWGDPPRHDCKGAGNVMTSDTIRIVEFWCKPSGGEWERKPEYEFRVVD